MTDRDDRWQSITRAAPTIGVVVLFGGAAVMALRVGVPAAILWFGFAALTGAILLFWEAMRSVLDTDASDAEADAMALVAGEQSELDAKKRAALNAIKELDFEHSIGRLSDEDHHTLREKYRAEAREAMEAIDRGLGAYLTQARAMVTRATEKATTESSEAPSETKSVEPEVKSEEAKSSEPVAVDGRVCEACGTRNDADAVFCKKCAARLAEKSE